MDPILIFGLLILIFSIIVHEVAHGYAANALGDPTARLQGRLTLNPLPHIDPIGSVLLPGIMLLTNAGFLFGWAKPVPYNPYNFSNQRWGEAWVAFAGPGVNLIIALVFGLLVRFGEGLALGGPAFLALAEQVVTINILLALFNLLPIPPLDGSKIIKALLPYRLSFAFEKFEQAIIGLGFVGLFLILFLFIQVFSGPFGYAVDAVVSFIVGR